MAIGETLLEESLKLVPQDTTALMLSGKCYKQGHGVNTVVIVGYGSKDFRMPEVVSPKDSERTGKVVVVDRWPYRYAVYVHQDPDLKHSTGQAFFLSLPRESKYQEMRQAFWTGMGRM